MAARQRPLPGGSGDGAGGPPQGVSRAAKTCPGLGPRSVAWSWALRQNRYPWSREHWRHRAFPDPPGSGARRLRRGCARGLSGCHRPSRRMLVAARTRPLTWRGAPALLGQDGWQAVTAMTGGRTAYGHRPRAAGNTLGDGGRSGAVAWGCLPAIPVPRPAGGPRLLWAARRRPKRSLGVENGTNA